MLIERNISDIPKYDLNRGIEKFAYKMEWLYKKIKRPVVGLIAGGTSSGKSTVISARTAKILGDGSVTKSCDDYYHGLIFMRVQAANGFPLTWDEPKALDLDLAVDHLKCWKSNTPFWKKIYSFNEGMPIGVEKIRPKKQYLFEGLFTLNPPIANYGNFKVFVNIDTHGMIIRRLLNYINKTGQNPHNILKDLSTIIIPLHEKYVKSSMPYADMIIENQFIAELEGKSSGLIQNQLKFATIHKHEDLRKIGAEILSLGSQIDSYYSSGTSLPNNEEIVRFRQSGGKWQEADFRIFTWKGPKHGQSNTVNRPYFEFVTSDETEDAFKNIYGDTTIGVEKNRTLYSYNGTIFSLDTDVLISKNGRTNRPITGEFIELRGLPDDPNLTQFEPLLKKLNIPMSNGIKKSYCEMYKM